MLSIIYRNELKKRYKLIAGLSRTTRTESIKKELSRTFFSPKELVESTIKKISSLESTNIPLKLSHYQERILNYKPSQLYLVISDVKKYNEFLPYCKASEVYKLQKLEDKSYMEAKLTIGFLNFEESYTSKVKCWENKLIIAQNENSNLFKTLTNRWEIESYGQGSRLKFHLDFELNSPLYHSVAKLYFESIASEMVKAFESRCQQLYSQ